MPAGLTGLQGNSNQRKKSGGGGRLSRLTTEDQGCGSQCSLSLLPPSPAWPVGEWTFLDARLFSLAWRLLRACVHPGLRLGWNIVRAGCRWGVGGARGGGREVGSEVAADIHCWCQVADARASLPCLPREGSLDHLSSPQSASFLPG